MGDSVGVPLIVFTRQDDNVVAINNILRQAGHPVHCTRVEELNEFEEALRRQRPELVILFADEGGADTPSVMALISKVVPNPPLLIAAQRVDEQTIADAMECGARDVVSLTHRNRLQAVVDREIHAYRLKVALGGVVTSAKQYRMELRNLMEGTAEPIVDIQEGIVVSANPPWLELFGYDNAEDVLNLPFMDMCSASDQEMLKGALVACLKRKWDGATLKIRGSHASDGEFPIEINLERVTIDGEPAVRAVVPNDKSLDSEPAELVEQAVYKDPATGFYHRHYFVSKLEQCLAQSSAAGVRAIAYVRPDNFARVHDDIGMLATEDLLTKLAGLLRDFMQPNDLYGRFGGTMFIAMLSRGTMNDVEAWAEQLRKLVETEVFEIDSQSTSLTCTIGLYEIDTEDMSMAEMLATAEQACREGRDAGGNRVELCKSTNATQTIRAQDALWVPRIRAALMENRLRLVHQPISGLTEDIERVFDTRVQMIDEQNCVVHASEFIPAAERANMIKNVDRWVVGASLSFCAAKNPSLVFVRLSGGSVQDESLIHWLKARAQSAGIEPGRICFQVSEAIAAQFLRQTKELADEVRAMGFRFAIDHVGLGRDPEQLLNHIPMDFMKIDGSLMQGLHKDSDTQGKVANLTNTAKKLDIKSIAERVEDANTMAILWQLGIAYIQGNYVQMHGVVLEDTHTISGII
ncbi:MAG: EAL domain-containing protein [Gammaproteobacteria bacterium]|nr:EAL domain-containing protein [Gammaproteobacteria bacterium]